MEDLQDVLLPIHVNLIRQTPPLSFAIRSPLRIRRLDEASVLGAHAQVVDVAEVFLEEVSVAA
jgi:hypothetical protein